MGQVFAACEKHLFSNGAIGWSPGGSFDCIGPYAKVQNCPIQGSDERLTCYATGVADTFFSMPACTRKRGKHVTGTFVNENGAVMFRPHDKYKHLFSGGKKEKT